MREILFRGKRLDNGEWVEGFLCKAYTHDVPHTHDGIMYKAKQENDCNGWSGYEYMTAIIDLATVGQYTGLKDKNGKRIFEGDVVYSIHSKKKYPVLFGEYTYINDYGDEESACGWYNEEPGYAFCTAIGGTENWAVVVGNIHDNPELL